MQCEYRDEGAHHSGFWVSIIIQRFSSYPVNRNLTNPFSIPPKRSSFHSVSCILQTANSLAGLQKHPHDCFKPYHIRIFSENSLRAPKYPYNNNITEIQDQKWISPHQIKTIKPFPSASSRLLRNPCRVRGLSYQRNPTPTRALGQRTRLASLDVTSQRPLPCNRRHQMPERHSSRGGGGGPAANKPNRPGRRAIAARSRWAALE